MLAAITKAGEGMQIGMDKLEVTAHNLANIDTTGYKKNIISVKTFKNTMENYLSGGSSLKMDLTTSFAQGALRSTQNELDVALNSDGFFAVQSNSGKTFYTRNGAFSRSADGFLVTTTGEKVLGKDDAPIQVGDKPISIDSKGHISGGQQLKIVDFDKPYKLHKIGNTLFATDGNADPKPSENALISQGYLELSNVSSIEAMVEMISIINTVRNAETDKEVIRSQEGTLDKVINSLGSSNG